MKCVIIPASQLTKGLNARSYIESDVARVRREARVRFPGKFVAVTDNHDGTFRVRITETFIAK